MARGMRSSLDVEYSAVGEGRGMREFWLYVWLRRLAVVAAHIISLGLVILTSILSRPGTSLFSWHPVCMSLGVSFYTFKYTKYYTMCHFKS
ncbi:cytochrome b561 domain-containing protein 1-like [Sinocyclocheilus grahami]|uniref:cytochrome b561 domain-containing protein 1-like n=1 Tax=Sinocyclocheilus grahami TaxID=75366 RepID=UPI0007ACBB63|nr:PREDICTED: cytochrome b561 domain-containing protein 1-like [Sinocyclocheilus grahami]